MRTSVLVFAMLLAACGQEADNGVNAEAEINIEAAGAEDIPIPNGGSAPPPGAPGNHQAPAPPQQNDSNPAPEPSGEITLAASPRQASAGAPVRLVLTNGSRQAIGYNLCTSALQTAAGGAVQTDRVCTLELRTLQPGRTADYRYELPGDLSDGSYRFSTGLERMPSGGRLTVSSNTIEVR